MIETFLAASVVTNLILAVWLIATSSELGSLKSYYHIRKSDLEDYMHKYNKERDKVELLTKGKENA